MDKSHAERLAEGLARLSESLPSGTAEGLSVPPGAVDQLLAYADELLRWNARVNLTAITDPAEVVEKHLLDSLAVLPELQGATSLVDLGSGAGLPGIPLALARPAMQATLVESVGKKVAFLKSAIVRLGLAGRVKAVQVHARGAPEEEGVPRAQVVTARALMEPAALLALAEPYVEPRGWVVVMLGRALPGATLAAAAPPGLRLVSTRTWALPFSGDPRAVAVFSR